MPEKPIITPRLCLVTPAAIAPDAFAPALAEALSGGDVASLIVSAATPSPAAFQRIAEVLTPVAQAAGVAVLIRNDTRIAGRVGADGVHVDGGIADLRDALRLRPKHIVGAGGAAGRHAAMSIGETEPDYIFFGRVDGDEVPDIHPDALALAEWWAPLFEIPAVLMAGSSLASIAAARATGAEFIALRRAVWEHPEGPAAAVREANRLLSQPAEKAA
jgi:thiamine-phosphate pyrophosphorylase